MGLELTGIALVTGAGGGIGRATVLQFVKDGCTRLVVTDIVEKTLNETVEFAREVNSAIRIEAIVGDLTSEDFVEELVSEVVRIFGGLNYAVNTAGITGKSLATDEMEFEQYRAVQRINMEALWLCERAEIRVMLEQDLIDGARGSIVNVASVLGISGSPRAVPYVVSKHAIIGMTKSDACTYATQGIRVNCVSPGFNPNQRKTDTRLIDTPLTRPFKERFEQYFIPRVPMLRLGEASEVANVIAFLSSGRASFVTGANYIIDGGFSAQ